MSILPIKTDSIRLDIQPPPLSADLRACNLLLELAQRSLSDQNESGTNSSTVERKSPADSTEEHPHHEHRENFVSQFRLPSISNLISRVEPVGKLASTLDTTISSNPGLVLHQSAYGSETLPTPSCSVVVSPKSKNDISYSRHDRQEDSTSLMYGQNIRTIMPTPPGGDQDNESVYFESPLSVSSSKHLQFSNSLVTSFKSSTLKSHPSRSSFGMESVASSQYRDEEFGSDDENSFMNVSDSESAEGQKQYTSERVVKRRLRASREQLKILDAAFQENKTPSAAFKRALAAELKMPHKSVVYWFQNRRAQLQRQKKRSS